MTDHAPLGRVLPGDPPVLEYVRRLPHAIEKVWRAVTSRDHLRAWLPCDIIGERREGAEVQLPFWPEVLERHQFADPGLTGTIRVWKPPNVFEWTWDTDVVRFALEADGDHTVLTLTTWLSGDAETSQTAAGYHVCLDHLAQVLDTGTAPPVADADPSELEARYEEAVAASSVRPQGFEA
jgi:uncharacterized protein YndB with AHSA1/START domain